ncbi:MAG: hypothetical protein WC223_13495 [Bacteroidales bacterium]|jgi:hypothetical protein
MILLYKFIFYKVYFFYVRVFKEEAIPHYFTSTIVSLLFVCNVVTLEQLYLYFINQSMIGALNNYDKYFALVVLFSVILFVSFKKRYLTIIKECEELPKEERKNLAILSILYASITFICFFWSGYLIREYNFIHPLR